MNYWKTMDGICTVSVTSADPSNLLEKLNRAGIQLWQVIWMEELTVCFQCSRRDRRQVEAICRRRGDRFALQREAGLKQGMKRLYSRPVLVLGILILFALTLFLPTRVLFLRVEGNETVPGRRILEAAEGCGIRFGVSRRQVRSEKMKNTLLEAMPELKWAGINTSGCTAVISVRERAMEEHAAVEETGVSSITAVRDAYVTDLTVTRGSALCTPGQVVSAGQILISGYTDLGLCLQVTRAQGEVFGETIHHFRAVTPSWRQLRQQPGEEKHRYSLILGKKRINFGKGSGISPVTCGRMYKEYYMTLPGGFQLPVCLAVETLIPWDASPAPAVLEEDDLQEFARDQILAGTVAGTILTEELTMTRTDSTASLVGRFSVHEMIGRVTKEQIGETHGKTD